MLLVEPCCLLQEELERDVELSGPGCYALGLKRQVAAVIRTDLPLGGTLVGDR